MHNQEDGSPSNRIYATIQSLLSYEEVNFIKGLIRNQIETVCSTSLPHLEMYHLLSPSIHVEFMSRKSSRIFNPRAVEELTNRPFFKSLQTRFDKYKISNIVSEGGREDAPEIYFRLVRPNKLQDVGDPHCDHWSHSAYGIDYGGVGSTWKVWIAIVSEEYKNGLEIFPNAVDQGLIPWEFRDGRILCDRTRPELGIPQLQRTGAGDAVIFRDDVLHAGAHNFGSTTRVSVEITFIKQH
jgi:hypothetical protein